MGVLSLTLAIGAANGFVLAALLAFSGRSGLASRILALLIAVLSWRAGMYIIGYAGAYDAHPWLTFFPFDLSLSYGPLLWLHVSSLTTGRLPQAWRWHFLPAALQLFYFLACFALPLEAKWAWYSGAHLSVVEPIFIAVTLASAFHYLAASHRLARDYQAWLDSAYANRDEARLGGLRALIAAYGMMLLVGVGFALTGWLVHPLDYFDRFPLMVAFAILTYVLGFLGWRNMFVVFPQREPEVAVMPPDAATPEAAIEPAGPDTAGLRRQQAEKVSAQVLASDWWRDEDLDLEGLSRKLGMSSRTLSRVLSEGLGTNFREFIGRIRVDAVARELERAGDEVSVLTLAMNAGFKSKASFNRAFKAYRGVTPSEYRSNFAEKQGLKIRQSASGAGPEAT